MSSQLELYFVMQRETMCEIVVLQSFFAHLKKGSSSLPRLFSEWIALCIDSASQSYASRSNSHTAYPGCVGPSTFTSFLRVVT